MRPDVPQWRVWMTMLLAALWGVLAISTARQENWPFFALCSVMFLWNAYQLWIFTRKPRGPQ